MKRLAITLAVAVALAIPAAAISATPKPVCHWTHHKTGNVTYYVQVCVIPRHVSKHHANRWNQAGPGNSVKPHIG
jgi:hypothetical protein